MLMNTARPWMLCALIGLGAAQALPATAATISAPAAAPGMAQRSVAASATARDNAACKPAQPFYWEIGDRHAPLASGSVGGNTYNADTEMLIASASKWVFGAYAIQRRNGQLSDSDIHALNMTSGYTHFGYTACKLQAALRKSATVASCFEARSREGHNDDFDAQAVGRFYYAGGHFQKMAVDLGLGNDDSQLLTRDFRRTLGEDLLFHFDSPQMAGGMSASAAQYGLFLRKILSGDLRMHDVLGANAVCTNPATCPSALHTPIPSGESWHYSMAHWVEDDPKMGDGAFSSPGAFGFYPWIDASQSWYGILARKGKVGGEVAVESVQCGRLIRKAWVSGVQQ
ncbi:MAG: hypothetical protein QM718_15005 [Steroidobacteraceae bacterium]